LHGDALSETLDPILTEHSLHPLDWMAKLQILGATFLGLGVGNPMLLGLVTCQI